MIWVCLYILGDSHTHRVADKMLRTVCALFCLFGLVMCNVGNGLKKDDMTKAEKKPMNGAQLFGDQKQAVTIFMQISTKDFATVNRTLDATTKVVDNWAKTTIKGKLLPPEALVEVAYTKLWEGLTNNTYMATFKLIFYAGNFTNYVSKTRPDYNLWKNIEDIYFKTNLQFPTTAGKYSTEDVSASRVLSKIAYGNQNACYNLKCYPKGGVCYQVNGIIASCVSACKMPPYDNDGYCKNGGECEIGDDNKAMCSCTGDAVFYWKGKQCQEKARVLEDGLVVSIVLAVVFAAVMIIILIATFAFRKGRKVQKKKQRLEHIDMASRDGKSNPSFGYANSESGIEVETMND